jgi:hypothetical protein
MWGLQPVSPIGVFLAPLLHLEDEYLRNICTDQTSMLLEVVSLRSNEMFRMEAYLGSNSLCRLA